MCPERHSFTSSAIGACLFLCLRPEALVNLRTGDDHAAPDRRAALSIIPARRINRACRG
jgi:hypothetical protein